MNEVRKILIIRFSSIGDVVLASSLIRGLRTAYPRAQIDFLVKSHYADLVRFNHHLSSVIELEPPERDAPKTLCKRIRDERYDVIVDIHNSLRSRYLRLFSRANLIVVVSKRVVARFLLVKFKWNFYRRVVSVADRYLEAAKSLGVSSDGKGMELFIPDQTASSVASMLGKFRLERYDIVVGCAPAARHFTKRWPMERFVNLGVQFARDYRAKILIFGGPEDAEYCGDIAQMINTSFGGNIAESFAGKFSLLETAAALAFCDIVVSNDTGVMHLAAAQQRKVVAIFGSTVREFGFFPYGTEHCVVENKELRCRPCSHIGSKQCPQGHFKCMKDITVDEVLTAAKELLTQMTPESPVRSS